MSRTRLAVGIALTLVLVGGAAETFSSIHARNRLAAVTIDPFTMMSTAPATLPVENHNGGH